MPKYPLARKTLVPILLAGAVIAGGYVLLSSALDSTAPIVAANPAPTDEAREETMPAPTLVDQREEDPLPQAAAAPVSPEQSLLDFAHAQAGLLDEALESEEAALEGFAKLESCADGQASVQVRLICLSNAHRLTEQYPAALQARLERLQARNRQLVGMLRSTGL